MGKKTVALTLETEFIIEKLGIRIKKARLRRNIIAEVLADQAGISKGTLSAIEKGVSSVSIGAYASVLCALDLENDLDLVAVDGEGKRIYQGTQLQQRKRATKQN